jgi:hypothetical protein
MTPSPLDEHPLVPTATAADQALAATAGAVERFPLLQRGERGATRQPVRDSGSADYADDPQSGIGGMGSGRYPGAYPAKKALGGSTSCSRSRSATAICTSWA